MSALQLLFLCLLAFSILHAPADACSYSALALQLWFEKMIPALFPFMVLSGLIVRLDLGKTITRPVYPLIGSIFRISRTMCTTLLTGFLFGFPLGAKTIAEQYSLGQLSKPQAQYLLSFCNNIGPVYLLSFALPLLGLSDDAENHLLRSAVILAFFGIPLLYGLALRYTLCRNIPFSAECTLPSVSPDHPCPKAASVKISGNASSASSSSARRSGASSMRGTDAPLSAASSCRKTSVPFSAASPCRKASARLSAASAHRKASAHLSAASARRGHRRAIFPLSNISCRTSGTACSPAISAAAGKPSVSASEPASFLSALDASVTSACSAIARLGGYMVFFMVCNLLFEKTPFAAPVAALLEITSGLTLAKDALSPALFMTMLTFGGLSCFAQTYTCIRDTDLSFGNYCLHKLLQSATAFCLYTLLFSAVF